MARVLLAVVVALLLAGCGGGDEAAPTEPTQARAYFLRDGHVWPVRRELDADDVTSAALASLYEGPSAQEQADLELTTSLPDGQAPEVTVEEGVARIESDETLSDEALAQVVYTLTQFPSVEAVEVDKRYTRADFEDQTPPVLVESPLPFEDVTSPLRATGTANTFEATFNYELTDTDGKIVDENFVTATSGTGTRGTFDFTTKPFTVPFDGIGSLIVFERSAEDGSRIHIVEIPLRMSR